MSLLLLSCALLLEMEDRFFCARFDSVGLRGGWGLCWDCDFSFFVIGSPFGVDGAESADHRCVVKDDEMTGCRWIAVMVKRTVSAGLSVCPIYLTVGSTAHIRKYGCYS